MKKRFILSTLLMLLLPPLCAQRFDSTNSISRIAVLCFEKSNNGIFQKKENVPLNEVSSIISFYGYNRKTHELYVEAEYANCIITVNEDYHKLIKKDKSIPKLSQEELNSKAVIVNNQLMNRITLLNETRQQFINDSIEQERVEAIRKAREDSLRLVCERVKALEYMNTKRWFDVPVKNTVFVCEICEEMHTTKEELSCYKIKNDTIYWGESKKGILGVEYQIIHVAKIHQKLKEDRDFQFHCKVFADSLENKFQSLNYKVAIGLNLISYEKYLEQIKKEAPNGIVLSWGWSAEYSNVAFNFRYMNTNKNTIKYIEVFWTVKNDVGDVRKTGSFKGTGPLEEWESASWNWDHSTYYVSGDATTMSLAKIVITYMNGSKVTIPKDKIKIDY